MKAVLFCLPVLYLSLFKLPKGIAKEINKIQASFFMGRPRSTEENSSCKMVRGNKEYKTLKIVHQKNKGCECVLTTQVVVKVCF